MLKMYTKGGKWTVEDNGVKKEFDTAWDAWGYIFLMREIRPNAPQAPKAHYPVKTLNPSPIVKQKKISYTFS